MPASNWDPTEFQAAIQRWLDRTGMSQTQAAAAAGLRQSVLNKWLQPVGANVQPTYETLERLAPAMGLPLDEVLRLAGRRKGEPPEVPAELLEIWHHVQAGYNESDEQQRAMRKEATLAIWGVPHRRRPNRRDVGNNRPHGDPKSDWLNQRRLVTNAR